MCKVPACTQTNRTDPWKKGNILWFYLPTVETEVHATQNWQHTSPWCVHTCTHTNREKKLAEVEVLEKWTHESVWAKWMLAAVYCLTCMCRLLRSPPHVACCEQHRLLPSFLPCSARHFSPCAVSYSRSRLKGSLWLISQVVQLSSNTATINWGISIRMETGKYVCVQWIIQQKAV